MTKQQILTKAIEKAEKNGWDKTHWQLPLQQMVITDDWLKYIESFLEEA